MSEPADQLRPKNNRILSALPAADLDRLRPLLQYVELAQGEIMHRPEEPITHVYFPHSGTISITAVMEDGGEAEVGVIGREGMMGLPIVLGTDSSPLKAVIQVPGGALRMRAREFKDEVGRCGEMYRLLLKYAQAFFIQTAITAACNRLHPLEGRLAKWLLTNKDRAQSDTLPLTQEFLGVMLGVRRAGVSEAVGSLESAGHITHARGQIRIADEGGLERAACECYRVVRKEYDRLLGPQTHY